MSFALKGEVTPQIVGVICTRSDLRRATRMRNPPDLFELRLDAVSARTEEAQRLLEQLSAPLIITARHPQEGGANNLSLGERRSRLLRFLPHAAFVDIELRSAAAFTAVMCEARGRGLRIILSFHDLRKTPNLARLNELLFHAQSLGAFCLKIATRTDTPAERARLLEFFQLNRRKMKIAAMGIGRFGMVARRELFRRGSILNYAHLGRATVAGQPSVSGIRRWSKRAF